MIQWAESANRCGWPLNCESLLQRAKRFVYRSYSLYNFTPYGKHYSKKCEIALKSTSWDLHGKDLLCQVAKGRVHLPAILVFKSLSVYYRIPMLDVSKIHLPLQNVLFYRYPKSKEDNGQLDKRRCAFNPYPFLVPLIFPISSAEHLGICCKLRPLFCGSDCETSGKLCECSSSHHRVDGIQFEQWDFSEVTLMGGEKTRPAGHQHVRNQSLRLATLFCYSEDHGSAAEG